MIESRLTRPAVWQTKLNLSDNKISMVRKELMDLEFLEIVDLSENNMKHFPTVLCSLSLLMDLKIGHNNITRLPVQLGRLSNLKKLGLEGLQLIQPAAEIANLSAPGIVEYMRKFFRGVCGRAIVKEWFKKGREQFMIQTNHNNF